MFKRILFAVLIAVLAIVCGVAVYLYSISDSRPDFANTPKNIECLSEKGVACENSEQWLSNHYQNHPVPSISALVTINGTTVWRGVIGRADLANKKAATFDTQYPIGSISKSLTAVATLNLQQTGQINIDDDFQRYANDYPTKHERFTLKQLLSHQAGIRHYNDELSESFNDIHYPNIKDAVGIVENDPLLFPPGTDFTYSSYAYSLVALALERATKQDYPSIMQDTLFTPLAMEATRLNTLEKTAQQTQPYLVLGSLLIGAPTIDYSNKYAGAGFLSTPSDLAKLGNALLNGSLLNEASTTLLFTPTKLDTGEMNPQNYALGFRIDGEGDKQIYHHGGMINGGYSYLAIYPEHQAVVVFSMNAVATDFDRQSEADTLLNYFIN